MRFYAPKIAETFTWHKDVKAVQKCHMLANLAKAGILILFTAATAGVGTIKVYIASALGKAAGKGAQTIQKKSELKTSLGF